MAFCEGLGSILNLVPSATEPIYDSESAAIVLGYTIEDDFADDWLSVYHDFASVLFTPGALLGDPGK